VQTLADLTRPGLRYVNRAIGTGTRVLFDELLADAGLPASAINGYETSEPSHAAVAQAVASGAADAGLGIEAAARSRGLDFVPLVEEQYHLVCLKSALGQPAVQQLLQLLHSAEWLETVNAMPGYAARQSGEVLSLKSELPWWTFKPR
jgi:putative molybdopterin biosynthesis protein